MILLGAKIVGLEAVDATRAVEVDIEAVAGAALLAASLESDSKLGSACSKVGQKYEETLMTYLV
jgi:hypothetical protein